MAMQCYGKRSGFDKTHRVKKFAIFGKGPRHAFAGPKSGHFRASGGHHGRKICSVAVPAKKSSSGVRLRKKIKV